MQALIAIENNDSTYYKIFLFAGVVILYINREGGAQNVVLPMSR